MATRHSTLVSLLIGLAGTGFGACDGVGVTPGDNRPGLPTPGDRDGDGLSDEEELAGWTILVDTTGFAKPGTTTGETQHLESRFVTSDPDVADTDGDGLVDGAERTAQADPRRVDTDGDGLSDADEVLRYASTPNAVDSDGDARGTDGTGAPNTRLFDAAEVAIGSSPVLADTDADGISDFQEIIDGGSHPAISDLPRLSLSLVDAPSITLNAVEASATSEALEATSASLVGSSQSISTSDSYTNETTLGFRESVSNETSVEVNFNPLEWSAGASSTTKVEFEATQTFSNSATHSVNRDSARSAQESFQQAQTREQTASVSYESGTIRVALRIGNDSDAITLRVSGVTIIVKRFDALTNGMVVVGELSAVNPIDDNVAAGDAIEAVFENRELAVADIKAILSDPRGLSFSIGRYGMRRVDASGAPTIDYAALAENLARQCGLLVIDHGDGRVERHSVATNLERDAAGRPIGTSLQTVLALLERDDVTTSNAPDGSGHKILWSVGGADTDLRPGQAGHRFWGVIANDVERDLGDITLERGQRVTFAYLSDDDGDTLFNREELAIGTDRDNVDTDDDGLSDALDPMPLVAGGDGVLPAVPTVGLMAWWKLGHPDADSVFDFGPDMLPTTNRCDTNVVADRHGDFGGGLDFGLHNPSGRCYAEVEDFQLPESSSMSVWLKRSNQTTSAGFAAGQHGRYAIYAGDQQWDIQVWLGLAHKDNGVVLEWAPETGSALSDWVHVVTTLGPASAEGIEGVSRMTLYINGELVDEAIVEADALANRLEDTECPDTFFFGGADWPCRDNYRQFSGSFDDLRVYDRALTPSEVLALTAEPEDAD